MSQIVSFSDQKKSIKAFLDKAPDSQYADVHPRLQSLSPKQQSIEINRLKQIALVQIDKNPKIAKCDPMTIYTSLRDAAKLGLLPDSTTNEGHLVPFWSTKNKRMECQFMAGYKGLIKLAMRTGHVYGVDVRAVHANDNFSFGYGLNPHCDHVPAMSGRGEFVGAYAVVELKEGSKKFHYESEQEGLEHGEKYTNAKDKEGEVFGNWKDNPIPMIMKTALRKTLKYCPLSGELDAAIHIDEAQHDPYYEHEPKALSEHTEEIADPEEITGGEQETVDQETGGAENGQTGEHGQTNANEETQGAGKPKAETEKKKNGKAGTGKQNQGTSKPKEEPEVEYCPEGVCEDIKDYAVTNGIKSAEYDLMLGDMKIPAFNKIPKGGHGIVMEAVKREIKTRDRG